MPHVEAVRLLGEWVDFSYSVNGEMYDFSLPGGEKIALSDLIEVLGIIRGTQFDTVSDFIAEIKTVEFSDPTLVDVTPVTEGGVLGIGAETVDWEMESLKAFDTEETLTITMKNGDVISIRVTDAQVTNLNDLKSNVNYVIYTGSGNNCYVLKPDGTTEKVSENAISGLDNSYRWRFSVSYNDGSTNYYNIRPVNNGGAGLALSWSDQPLVQQGNNNIKLISQNGGYRIEGYNNACLYLNGSTIVGSMENSSVFKIEGDSSTRYTVRTASASMGKVNGQESFSGAANTSGKNSEEISAVAESGYLFDHWELNGQRIGNGAIIAADSIELSAGSTLTAYFRVNENQQGNDGRPGRIVNKGYLDSWLEDLASREFPLNKADTDKTAQVYDYENRIYQVDITTRSNVSTFSGDVDLAFIIDVSGSMLFPSKLNKVAGKENVQLTHLNDNATSKASLDQSKAYYIIADEKGTSTVYRIWFVNDTDPNNAQYPNGYWKACDASEYQLGHTDQEFRIGWGTKFSNDETDKYYQIYEDGDNGRTRQYYLQHSLDAAIKDLKDASVKLSIAEEGKSPKINVAWNTFAENVYRSVDFTSVSPDSQVGPSGSDLTTHWYTSTDRALNDAANNFNWNNINGDQKYAILITDGAPQRNGSAVPSSEVQSAASNLKSKANLISVGLSMSDVIVGSNLLDSISSTDENGSLFYRAESGDELEYIIREIVRKIMVDAIVVGDVQDEIDPAFYPVDQNGNALNDGAKINLDGTLYTAADQAAGKTYGVISKTDDTYTVKWDNQDMPWEGWKGSVLVKAKEDFLGGNTINTNKAAKIMPEGYKVSTGSETIPFIPADQTTDASKKNLTKTVDLDTPYVNVDELRFTEHQTEVSVKLGDEVESMKAVQALWNDIDVSEVVTQSGDDHRITGSKDSSRSNPETFKLKDIVKLTTQDWQTLLNGGTVTKDYKDSDAYGHDAGKIIITLDQKTEDTEPSIKDDLNADGTPKSHKTTEEGEEVEKYTLTVQYAPNGADGTKNYHTTQGGDPGDLTNYIESTNVHIVNVQDGVLEISKRFTGNYDFPDKDNVTFTVTGPFLKADGTVEQKHTFGPYKYSDFADSKKKLTKADGITYGTYTVTESGAQTSEEGVTLTQTVALNGGTAQNGASATVTLTEENSSGTVSFENRYEMEGEYQIQITKYIVDEKGNQIGLAADTSTSFKIYRSATAGYDSVVDLNVDKDTAGDFDVSSYTTEFGSLAIDVGTGGWGIDYAYHVPGGMYTIEEDKGSVPQTIVDSNGNKWEYVGTRMETEYAWRAEGDTNKRHYTKEYDKDSDARLIAVPEVAGKYGVDADGNELENKVLDFFATNVYKKSDDNVNPDTMDLTINKAFSNNGSNVTLESGSVIFRLHQMRTITSVDGTGKDTVTTEQDAQNSGYPTSITVTAEDGWTKTVTDLPFKVQVDENTTVTYSYYLEEVSRVGDAREYSDVSFTDNIGGDKEHAVVADKDGETVSVSVTNSKTDTPPDDKQITIKKTWLDQYGNEPKNHPDEVTVDVYRIKLPEGSGGTGGTFNSVGGLYDVIGDPRSWTDNNNVILNDVIFQYKGEYYYVRKGQTNFSRWQLQEWADQLDEGYMSGDHVTKLVTTKIYTDEEINALAAANTPIRYGTVASWNGDYYVYRYTGGSFDNYAQQYGPSKSGNWSKIGKGNILDGLVITPPPNTRFVEENEITGGNGTIIGKDTISIGDSSYIDTLYNLIDSQLIGSGVEWSDEDKQLQLYLSGLKITKDDGWTATMTAEPGYLYFFFEHAVEGYTTTYGYEEYGVYDQAQNVEIVNQTTVDDEPVDLTIEKKWKNGETDAQWPTGYTVNYKVVQKVYLASLTSTLKEDGTGFDYSYEVIRSQFLYENKDFTDYSVDKGDKGVLMAASNQQKLSGLPVGKLWKPTEEELETLTADWTEAEIRTLRSKVEAGKTYSIGYVYEIVETKVTDSKGKEIGFDGATAEFDAVANKNNENNKVTLSNETTEITVKKAWTKNGQSYEENNGWFADAKVYFTVDKLTLIDGKEVDSETVYSSKEANQDLNASNKSSGVTVSNLPELPITGSWTAPAEADLTDAQKAAGVQAEKTYTVSYKYAVREDNENSTATGYSFPYAIEAERADNVYTITNDLTEIEVKKEWSKTPVSEDKVTVQLYSSTTPPAGGISEDKVRITVSVNKWEDDAGAEVSSAPTDPKGSITVEIKDPTGKVVDSFVLTANAWSATSRELPILEEGSGYTVAYKTADGTVVKEAKGFTTTKYNESTVVNITGVVPKVADSSDGITFGMVSWNGAGALQNTDHHFKIREFTRANGSFQYGFSPYDPDRNGSPAFGSENDHIVRKDDNNSQNNKNEIQISAVRELDSFDSGYYRFIVEKQGINFYYIRAIGGKIYYANDTNSGWPDYISIGSRGDQVSPSTKITGEVTYIIDTSVTKIEFSTEPFDTTSNARQANFLWDDEEEELEELPMTSSRALMAGPRKAPTLATTDKVSVSGSTNTGTNTFNVNDIAKTGQTPPSNLTPVEGTAVELDGSPDDKELQAWVAKWSNLPTVDENGNRIYYYVVETSATKSGATSMSADYRLTDSDYIKDINGNIIGIKHVTIMNTPGETGKISVSANKVWNVSGGLEKDNFVVEFTLYADEACTQIVSTANNPQNVTGDGKATWTNLNPGTYWVKETKVSYLKNGETTVLWNGTGTNQYLTNVNDGTDTFTNYATTYAVQKRWMTVDGSWDKDYDQTVYFHLKRDGVNVDQNGVPKDEVFTLTKGTTADGVVTADNLYIMRFPLLPGGEYTVVECTSTGTDLSQEATTNDNTGKSHKLCPEKVELTDGSELDVTAIKNDLYHIKAQKNWAESGVAPAYYPAVTFILKRTTDTVTDSYNWSSVAEYKTATLAAKPASAIEAERTVDFGTMPRFDENGNEYTYKVFEQPIAGYVAGDSVESVVDGIQTFTITNTPKTINLYVHKEWLEGENNVNDQHTDDVVAYDVYRQAYDSSGNKVGTAEKIALPSGVTGRLPVENKDGEGNVTGYTWQETVSNLPMTGTVVTKNTETGEVTVTPISYKYYVVETAFGSFTTEYYEENDIAHKSEKADDAEHQIGREDNGDQVVSRGTVIRNNMTPVDFSIEKIEKGNTSKKLQGAKFSVREIDIDDPMLPFKDDSTAKEGTTNENGLVKFEQLTTGYYKVTEIQSPDGYVMTGDNYFYIKVAEGKVSVVELDEKTGKWQKREDSAMLRYNPNSSTATVANEPGVALPASGGPGTTLFTILGSILIALAGAGLVMRRRRRMV